MGYQDGMGSSLPGASYSALKPPRPQNQTQEIKSALRDFLLSRPELAADPRRMEVMQYCFKHYINFDPELRDLTITEKLERACQMATDFLGSMFKL